MSLLYECINGIIQGGILDGEDNLQERDEVATLCVGKLRGMIVMDSDPNREYSFIVVQCMIADGRGSQICCITCVEPHCCYTPNVGFHAARRHYGLSG